MTVVATITPYVKDISTHTLTWSVTIPPDLIIITQDISTHTLTWSVTFVLFCVTYDFIISTHTLTWSVTSSLVTEYLFSSHFNSHAHVERDYLVR